MSTNDLIYKNWQSIIKPEKVQVTSSSNYGKFVCEPLERGFGITIGNALRRIILSSLYGAAIVSVKFENVMHEFSVIDGVLEDVSEIILNLKEVRLKVTDTEPKVLHLDISREGIVTARDITSDDGRCDILNPEQKIATLGADARLQMTMIAHIGKGYRLAEDNKDEEAPIGTIPIDAVFSPIKRVNYVVGNARVGQKTDYDKLTLEVWTDGSIHPENAVAYASKILKEQMSIFINFDEEREPEKIKRERNAESSNFNENLYRSVEELELSVRSANCLKNADIHKIYQLVSKTEPEMLKTKNFGRKSLNEIKEVLSDMGLGLGMKLDGFDPPEDDTEEGE
ncbi:MAG: DNA-directed RNA polymerase subunit alpha [Desulfobacterales bacterium]|jgi:DNA-directed RNA polymerase subunit alpha|nr:DNA-directed RNA polymerase subunit alpha [Desulfobacterales bacterium]